MFERLPPARARQAPPPLERRGLSSFGDVTFVWVTRIFALAVLWLVGAIAWDLWTSFDAAREKFGWGFLTSTTWNPVTEVYGALPFIYGTVVSSLLALLIATPIGIGVAICLSELAPNGIRQPLSFLVELLAAIPSVVYGLWGIFVLAPLLRNSVQPFLAEHFGWLPFFKGPALGVGMMTAGVILAIMILPTIAAISRDVLQAVPVAQREAALALGATRWEVTRMAVLPLARPGIVGGTMLGLGRALGETMAVTMLIGNRANISASLFSTANSMSSVIASEFAEALSRVHLSALVGIGLVLLGVTVLMGIVSRLLIWSVARRTGKVTL